MEINGNKRGNILKMLGQIFVNDFPPQKINLIKIHQYFFLLNYRNLRNICHHMKPYRLQSKVCQENLIGLKL